PTDQDGFPPSDIQSRYSDPRQSLLPSGPGGTQSRGARSRYLQVSVVFLYYSYLLGRPRCLGRVLKRQSCKRCDVPTSSKIMFGPKCDLMKRIKSASVRHNNVMGVTRGTNQCQ